MRQLSTLHNGIATAIVPALATTCLLLLPNGARAQAPPVGLSATINDSNGSQSISSSLPATGAISLSSSGVNANGGATTNLAIANYGLLGAQATASSIDDGITAGFENSGTARFTDKVFVTDGKSGSSAISMNITMSLFGSFTQSAGPDSGNTFCSLLAETYIENTFGGIINDSSYQENQSIDDGVLSAPSSSGSLTFTANVTDNSFIYVLGTFEDATTAGGGGSADSDYASTAVFNLSSTNPNTTFIGSSGTNYGTLTDTGASAPEPGSAILLLPAGIASLVGVVRRRRASASAKF